MFQTIDRSSKMTNFYQMLKSSRAAIVTVVLVLASFATVNAQAVVTIDNKKDACNGLFNGSFRITVTSGTAPLSLFVFGIGFGQIVTSPLTQGVPFNVTGLQPDNYIVSVSDGDPAANFSTFVSITNIATPLTITTNAVINNSDCTTPTGQISITAGGGSGTGYSYSWTATNGFTSTSEDLTGLAGGNYSVTVSDNGTNCTTSAGPILITDPSPAIQTITTPSPQSVCAGGDLTVVLGDSEPSPVSYTVFINGTTTGISLPGTGSALNFTVPAGLFGNGDVITIQGRNGACTPVNMSGSVSVNINPLPTVSNIQIIGTNPICAGGTLPDVTFTFTGTSPFNFTYTDGATSTNVNNHNSTTFTITNAPAGTYSITALSDANSCVATSLGGSVQVIVNPNPTVTVGTSPSVCAGGTSASLSVTGTTGSPDQYSLDFDAIAEGAGFVDVSNVTLTNPISIIVPGAAAPATYNATLSVRNSTTGCASGTQSISVTIIANPTITLGANPSVCEGSASANIPYSSTTGSPDQYTIDFDAAAEAAGLSDVTNSALTPVQITVTGLGGVAPGIYNGQLKVRNSTTGCESAFSSITITIIANPTITLSAIPNVCEGTNSVNLSYTSTSGAPDFYSIDFNAAAELQGFTDVASTPLPASPISLVIPGGAVPNDYTAIFTVTNSITGCSSQQTITIRIIADPTITLGANPSVCVGTLSTNLPYTNTTGTPDRYSIDFDGIANTAGFSDVTNLVLPVGQIPIIIPAGAPAGVYNGTVTVVNTTTGCDSSVPQPFTVTIVANPTITVTVASPQICLGQLSANIVYSTTSGSPDRYSIDFNAAANTAGFADVTNNALTGSPISVIVPGAAPVGTYVGTLTVNNSSTGCVSAGVTIRIRIVANPTLTLGTSPSVCVGVTTALLPYSSPSGSPNRYDINFDAIAEGQGFADVANLVLPASPINIIVPGAAAPAVYNAVLTVRNSTTGCSTTHPFTVTVIALPSITLGPNPSVCAGTASASLPFSSVLGSPDLYNIDFNAAANTAGFSDVANQTLPAAPGNISIAVPTTAPAGVYNGSLTVVNSATGCVSAVIPISVTVIAAPTVTLDASPSVCVGQTTANLPYTVVSGSPNQYSIDFDVAAEAQGFSDEAVQALPASPIVVDVPGSAAPGVYNATITILDSGTGCSSTQSFTVTININPTITVTNPSVCVGVPSVDLVYAGATGSPDQFSIDFDALAEGIGFNDVTVSPLPSGQISIVVPGGTPAGFYNGTVTVINSVTGCSSSAPIPFTIEIIDLPSITLGPNPSVCTGTGSVNLLYTLLNGAPNEFSIDFDAAANTAGFADMLNNALAAAPGQISIPVPGAAPAGVYNGTLTVRNTLTGCVSSVQSISVTVLTTPVITPSGTPSVCVGTPSANLAFVITAGTPDRYSIDFDTDAELQGFVDVSNQVLSGSPLTIIVPGTAIADDYNAVITVTDSGNGCSSTSSVIVRVLPNPAITLVSPSVCIGATSVNMVYTGTTAAPDQYTIDFDAAAEAAGFSDVVLSALTPGHITVIIGAGTPSGTYNGTVTVINSTTGCSSSPTAFSIDIIDKPTITLGAMPSVCSGASAASLPYTLISGGADEYSIDFDAIANAAGFSDVLNSALGVAPGAISIVVPGAAPAATYNGNLTIRNASTGCVSDPIAITVTVISSPSITLGANPSVCPGVTSASLFYTSTSGVPDQYSIDFDAIAEGEGFNDVINQPLPGSPIVILVPGAAASQTYNATLTVTNTGTGCASTKFITVTILDRPAITLLGNPAVCEGTSSANLAFTIGAGAPDFYAIDFDNAAELVGFSDVSNLPLSGSPLSFNVPGGAAPGVYNATILVRNNTTSCVGVPVPFTITIEPAASANAGADQSLCAGGVLTLSGASISGAATSGAWTIVTQPTSGDGALSTVAPTATPNTVMFTASVAGLYVLELRTDDPAGACGVAVDSVEVTVVAPPDAGLDGVSTQCNSENAFNLFAALGGTPDNGGTWTDTDGSGALITGNLVDLRPISAAGTYDFTYTVTDASGACPSDVSVVTLTIVVGPDAGLANTVTVCNTETAFNMLANLGGTPDAGGTWADTDGSGAPISGNLVDLTGLTPGDYQFTYTVVGAAPCANASAVLTIRVINTTPDAGTPATVQACNSETAFNLFNQLGGTPDPGGSWTALDLNAGVITGNLLNLTGVAAGTYRYQYDLAVVGCGAANAIVTVVVTDAPNAGGDGTATVCNSENSFNLFGRLTGTPDNGGTWADVDVSGALITGNQVDFTGIAAGTYRFRYIVPGVGPCANDTSFVTIDLFKQPDAGTDNTVDACNTDATFNLFNSLTGTPDAGGTWVALDAVGIVTGNTVDLTGVVAGNYRFQYTVIPGTGSPCVDDVAIVTVRVSEQPDAGLDGASTVCSSESNLDLFALLGGTPDTGGTWTDVNASGAVISGNLVDLRPINTSGVYSFRYTVGPLGACTTDQADVVLTISVAPDAGADRTVTACNTNATFNMLANLGGTPDTGGTWLDLDASGAAITGNNVDLTTLTPGDYRFQYTVTGNAPCVDAVAVLTIRVINTAPNPGTSATISACNSVTNLDLFAALGTADPGGVWTALDANSGVITGNLLNLNGVAAGTYDYQYDLNVVGCGAASAIITVNVTEAPDAGLDATVSSCNSSSAFNLLNSLGGTPDATGTWTDLDASGAVFSGNNVDFTGVGAGVYRFRYTVTGTAPCVDVSATVTVNLFNQPDAGADNLVQACNADTNFDLIGNLGGTPDAGGTWTSTTGVGVITGNFVNLIGVAPGDYNFEYIIPVSGGSVCVADTAVLTLRVIDGPDAGADSTITVCSSETAFNLFTAIQGTPDAGGTWIDVSSSGAVFTGNLVNFTAVTAGTYVFQYVVTGAVPCANDTSNVTVNVSAGPGVAFAGNDQIFCNGTSFTTLNATPASPVGAVGTWVVTPPGGAVISPNSPTSLFVGTVGTAYTLRWIVAAGTCPPTVDEVVINFNASPATTSPVTVCVNGTASPFTATATGATSFNWYLGSGASRTLLANTATGTFTPGAELNLAVVGSTTYEVTAVYACGESAGSPIVVNVSNTGTCSGGGGGGGTCPQLTLIDITPVLPTCADPDSGSLTFNLGATNSYDVTLVNLSGSLNQTERGNSNVVFQDLKAATYRYIIKDLGVPAKVCKDTVFVLDKLTVVQVDDKAVLQDVTCYGASEARVRIDASGSKTGKYYFSYVVGGIESGVQEFTPGTPLPTFLPADDTDFIVIKVDDNPGLTCYDTAKVRIKHLFPKINYTVAKTDVTTCNGTEGAINVTGITGGDSSSPLQIRLKKEDLSTIDPTDYIVLFDFEDLTGATKSYTTLGVGNYIVDIQDKNTCVQSTPIAINAPGSINFNVTKVADADCTNEGKSGRITIGFPVSSDYLVGISTSPVVEPTKYVNISSAVSVVPVDTLSRGNYFVYVKATAGTSCPSIKAISIGGAFGVAFTTERVCDEGGIPSVNLINITGDPTVSLDIAVYRKGNSAVTVDQFTVAYSTVVPIVYNVSGTPTHDFLLQPDDYFIIVSQNQPTCTESIDSDPILYTVTPEMKGVIDQIQASLPAPRQTGSFRLRTITGGSPSTSTAGTFYTVSVIDAATNSVVIGPVEVYRNAQNNYEKQFTNLSIGTYRVEIQDGVGCTISVTVEIVPDTRVIVPNIFTPNNDGINDVFEVVNLPAGKHKLVISNRWGSQVYSSNEYKEGSFWTAEDVAAGIYFYRLQVESGQTYTGWVEIVKGSKP